MTPVYTGFQRFVQVSRWGADNAKTLEKQGFLHSLGLPGYYWPKVEHYEDKELSD